MLLAAFGHVPASKQIVFPLMYSQRRGFRIHEEILTLPSFYNSDHRCYSEQEKLSTSEFGSASCLGEREGFSVDMLLLCDVTGHLNTPGMRTFFI